MNLLVGAASRGVHTIMIETIECYCWHYAHSVRWIAHGYRLDTVDGRMVTVKDTLEL